MLVNLLQNHKLRSMFDFEKAVIRELGVNRVSHGNMWRANKNHSGEHCSWNFRTLDLAAGHDTAVTTVYDLKEAGTFKGAKRKLKFSQFSQLSHGPSSERIEPKTKSLKMDQLLDTMQSLTINEYLEGEGEDTKSNTVARRRVTLKVSECTGGWHGGKRSPPKLVGMFSSSGNDLNTPSKERREKPSVSDSSRTPRNTVSVGLSTPLGTRHKRAKAMTGGKGQCSIRSFISCSPRARKDGCNEDGGSTK